MAAPRERLFASRNMQRPAKRQYFCDKRQVDTNTVDKYRESRFHLTMSQKRIKPIRDSVADHRARQIAAGRHLVNTYLPIELIELIDHSKESQGVRGRTPIIEQALKYYFENNLTQGA